MTQHTEWVNSSFRIDSNSPLLDRDEYDLIVQLPDLIPPGAHIFVNPWNGSSLAFAIANIPVQRNTPSYSVSSAEQTLNSQLNQAGQIPGTVCPAVQQLNVSYVLDFGDKFFTPNAPSPYPGLENLDTAAGFTLIAKVGHAALYRIDACNTPS